MEDSNLLNDNEVSLCSVCQEPLTLFGSKELKDGILCRNCAKELSEWLTDEVLKEKSVNEIKKHLRYRKRNVKKLNDFKPTMSYESKYDLYIDKEDRSFVVSKKKDYVKDNADVVKFWRLKKIRAYEKACELSDGVDILIDINLISPQSDVMTFRVNEFSGLIKDSEQYIQTKETVEKYFELFKEAGIKERKFIKDYAD